MSVDSRPLRARAKKTLTVIMRSRNNQRVLVQDPLDAQFLELADAFQMKARKITGELPAQERRPRASR